MMGEYVERKENRKWDYPDGTGMDYRDYRAMSHMFGDEIDSMKRKIGQMKVRIRDLGGDWREFD